MLLPENRTNALGFLWIGPCLLCQKPYGLGLSARATTTSDLGSGALGLEEELCPGGCSASCGRFILFNGGLSSLAGSAAYSPSGSSLFLGRLLAAVNFRRFVISSL